MLKKLKNIKKIAEQTRQALDDVEINQPLYDRLHGYGFKEKKILAILKTYKNKIEYVNEILDSVDIKIQTDTVRNVGGYIVKALEEDYRPVSSLKQKLEKDNAASKARETTEAEEKEKQIAANHYYKYKEDKVFEYVDCLDKEEVSALITDFGATFTLGQFERGQKWANRAEPGIKFEAIKESPALRTKFVNFVIEIFLADRILSFRDFSKNG